MPQGEPSKSVQSRFRVRPTTASSSNVVAYLATIVGVALGRRFGIHGFNTLRRLTGNALAAQPLRATWRGNTFVFPALDSYCGEMFFAGRYEPGIFAFLSQIRGESFGFVDGGANIGYWSVLLSGDWFGNHPTVAIEASAQTFGWLEQNRRANGSRFATVHAALHRLPGQVLAFDETAEHAARRVVASSGNSSMVVSTTVDEIVGRLLPGTGALVVKLDVEGAEPDALAGASKTRQERDCLFIIEDHASDEQHRSAAACFAEGLRLSLLTEDGTAAPMLDLGAVARVKVLRGRGYDFVAYRPDSSLARRIGLTKGIA